MGLGSFFSDGWNYVKDAATAGPARRLWDRARQGDWEGAGWQAANMGETPFGSWVETKATGRGDGKFWLSGPGDEGDVTGAEHAAAMQDAWRKAAERYRQIGSEAAGRFDAGRQQALGHYANAQSVYDELYGGGRPAPPPRGNLDLPRAQPGAWWNGPPPPETNSGGNPAAAFSAGSRRWG